MAGEMGMWLANLALMGTAYSMYNEPSSDEGIDEAPLAEFKLSAVRLGTPIPIVYGLAKIGGCMIEWGDWTVVVHENEMSKKAG